MSNEIDRRDFLTSAMAAAAGLAAAAAMPAVHATKENDLDTSAKRDPVKIIRSTLVVDGYGGGMGTGPLEGQAATDEYVRRLKAGGFSCMVGRMTHPDLVSARSVKEIRAAHVQGKIAQLSHTEAVFMSMDHLDPLTLAPFPVAKYQAEGLRIMGLCYHLASVYGGGCLEPQVPLTDAGRRMVEEAHKHRVLLDVGGRTGERTSLDAIAVAPEMTVVNTHGNVRALNDHPRANSDRVIEAIAKTGGVLGITSSTDFMARNPSNAHLPSTPQVGLDKFLDQIEYVKRLVGIDHVGVAPDNICDGNSVCKWPTLNRYVSPPSAFGEVWTWAKGFESVKDLPNVVKGLIERGWTTRDIRKVLGENWLRVYEKVWGE